MYITSPIFYMGNKIKLVKRGIIDFFPSNIDTFVEPFCGSCCISMNTPAKKYIINDISPQITGLIKMFCEHSPNKIISAVEFYKNKFNLEYGAGDKVSFHNRSKYFNKELSEIHKNAYKNLRDYYNENKKFSALYALLVYCFSHQMRFNSEGEFNMPCGNGVFTEENKKWIRESSSWFSKNIVILNNSYKNIKYCDLSPRDDFVYFDPPYLDTTATYNENGGWGINEENELHGLCENLDKNGIKWAMSNVFFNKDKENTQLIKWCKKNNYRIHHFEGFTYSACGKGNSKSDEVLIMNY